MAEPDVRIEPDAVAAIAARLGALTDQLRSHLAAAAVDAGRRDGPAGFTATAAAQDAWGRLQRPLEAAATDTALFGDNVKAAASVWQWADNAVAGRLARRTWRALGRWSCSATCWRRSRTSWREQAAAWLRLSDQLADRAVDLQQHTVRLQEAWQGRDASAGAAHGGQLRDAWRQRADDARRIGQVVQAFADQTDTARRRAEAATLAAFPDYLVLKDGSVSIDPIIGVRAALIPGELARLQAGRA